MANSREAVLMLDPARISGGPHTIVCAITRADLPDEMFDAQSGNRSNGTDARFFSMSGAELPRHYVAGSFMLDSASGAGDGQALYFVRFHADSASPGIKVQYGGGLADYALDAPYGRNATWADYRAVVLLNEANGPWIDVTGNGHDAILTTGSSIASTSNDHPWGDRWLNFTGLEGLTLMNSAQMLNGGAMAMSAWINLSVVTASNGLAGNRYFTTDTEWFQLNAGNRAFARNSGNEDLADGLAAAAGQTTFIAASHDGQILKLYGAGVVVNSDPSIVVTNGISTPAGRDYRLGTYYDDSSNRRLRGKVGCVKFSADAPSDNALKTEYELNRGGAWTPLAPVSLGGGAVIAETLHLGAVSNTQSTARLTIMDAMALGFGGDMGQGARNVFGHALELGWGHDLGLDPRLILEDAMVLSQSLDLTDEARLTLQDTISLGLYAAELYLTGAREAPLQSTLRLRAERLVHAVARDGRTYFPKFEKRSPKP